MKIDKNLNSKVLMLFKILILINNLNATMLRLNYLDLPL